MGRGRPHPDELPAHMAVLGLVIERPNETVAWYANALAQRFPRAGFGKSTAYSSLRQMAAGKSPRVQRVHEADGQDGSTDCYEVTPAGLEAFRSWVFRPPVIPAVREAVYGRIELVPLDDIPDLIRIVRLEEAIATDLYAQANAELRAHETAEAQRRYAHKTRADYKRRIRDAWFYVGPLHWSSRATTRLMVADYLEEIAQDAGVCLEGASGQADIEDPRAHAD